MRQRRRGMGGMLLGFEALVNVSVKGFQSNVFALEGG